MSKPEDSALNEADQTELEEFERELETILALDPVERLPRLSATAERLNRALDDTDATDSQDSGA